MKKKLGVLFLILHLSCLPSLLIAQQNYKDISKSAGIDVSGENIGVAFGDYDNDGDEDLYISVRDGHNKLFQNIDGQSFVNVAHLAGVDYDGSSRTSIWMDINNDNFLDLYVGNFDENDVLYLNKGDGTFEDISRWGRIYNPGKTFSVNAADVNQDGWIDLYVANFREENKLFLNRKDNSFTNAIDQTGAKSTDNAMGAVFFDYDNDRDPDLYLIHDGQPFILYKNTGGGNFVDVSEAAGVDYDGFGMGVDVGDVNNDGWLDLYVTNLYENVLYLNNGDGTFKDGSAIAKIEDYGMGWGTNFLDFNNDGKRDIYVTNDSYFSPYPNVLYKNMGDSTFQMMFSELEVASMQAGYGSAIADINKDGFVDIALANAGSSDHFQLFANQNEQGNWIGIKLEGVKSNRAAIGARIEIIDEFGQLHIDEVNAGSGYASMNSLVIHFGLGQAKNIKSGKIYWPQGISQEFDALSSNHYYKIVEGETPVLLEQTVTSAEDQLLNQFRFKVFPNPASNFINVSFQLEQSADYNWFLYDVRGKLVRHQLQNKGLTGKNSFQLENLPAKGIYQLVLSGKDFHLSKKVILK